MLWVQQWIVVVVVGVFGVGVYVEFQVGMYLVYVWLCNLFGGGKMQCLLMWEQEGQVQVWQLVIVGVVIGVWLYVVVG